MVLCHFLVVFLGILFDIFVWFFGFLVPSVQKVNEVKGGTATHPNSVPLKGVLEDAISTAYTHISMHVCRKFWIHMYVSLSLSLDMELQVFGKGMTQESFLPS